MADVIQNAEWGRKEENYQEYLRLLNDPDYYDVSFDEESGGVSAIHRNHRFDKQMGPFGCRRGDYEIKVVNTLRRNGHRVLLGSEVSPDGVKDHDGLLNDLPMDIKAVESNGVWSISSKLKAAETQGAEVVVFYFPEPSLYSKGRILDGIGKYESDPHINAMKSITSCLMIVEDQIVGYIKKTTTPSAEWFES